jgi:hypothetical protein
MCGIGERICRIIGRLCVTLVAFSLLSLPSNSAIAVERACQGLGLESAIHNHALAEEARQKAAIEVQESRIILFPVGIFLLHPSPNENQQVEELAAKIRDSTLVRILSNEVGRSNLIIVFAHNNQLGHLASDAGLIEELSRILQSIQIGNDFDPNEKVSDDFVKLLGQIDEAWSKNRTALPFAQFDGTYYGSNNIVLMRLLIIDSDNYKIVSPDANAVTALNMFVLAMMNVPLLREFTNSMGSEPGIAGSGAEGGWPTGADIAYLRILSASGTSGKWAGGLNRLSTFCGFAK